jgi:hypothetical protein
MKTRGKKHAPTPCQLLILNALIGLWMASRILGGRGKGQV